MALLQEYFYCYTFLVNTQSNLQKKLLQKKLAPLFKKYGITAAYLFGSEARGETHSASDIDIAIRVKRPLTLQKTLLLANELQKHFKKEIDLVDLDHAPLPLQYRVYRERTMLFAENPREEIKKQAHALCLYYDYQYYFKRFAAFEMNRIAAKGLI